MTTNTLPTAYILVVRDEQFWLIGPFSDTDAAGTWGRQHWDQSNGVDDPRWQTLTLAAPDMAPVVFSPRQAIVARMVP